MYYCFFGPKLLVSIIRHRYYFILQVINHNILRVTSDTIGNKGAIINITSDLKLDYKTFEAVVCLNF